MADAIDDIQTMLRLAGAATEALGDANEPTADEVDLFVRRGITALPPVRQSVLLRHLADGGWALDAIRCLEEEARETGGAIFREELGIEIALDGTLSLAQAKSGPYRMTEPIATRLPESPFRPARDVPIYEAMAAGPALPAQISGGQRLELNFDVEGTIWMEERWSAIWAAAGVRVELESIADKEELKLIFSNTEGLPEDWMFVAVGLTTGQKPGANSPPGMATPSSLPIPVHLPVGRVVGDVCRIAIYITDVGVIAIGCLVFRVADKDQSGSGS